MNTEKLEEIAEQIRALLLPLSDEARQFVLHELEFCYYCGADQQPGPCYCMRDD